MTRPLPPPADDARGEGYRAELIRSAGGLPAEVIRGRRLSHYPGLGLAPQDGGSGWASAAGFTAAVLPNGTRRPSRPAPAVNAPSHPRFAVFARAHPLDRDLGGALAKVRGLRQGAGGADDRPAPLTDCASVAPSSPSAAPPNSESRACGARPSRPRPQRAKPARCGVFAASLPRLWNGSAG